MNIWTEKYRPKQLDEVVGQDHVTDVLRRKLNNGKGIPHLLFYGKHGTGKTTTALVIGETLNADMMELNGSDSRGIDTIRGRVKTFARYKGFSQAPYKILMIDEAEQLTDESQKALKRIMEKNSHNCRFILLSNNLNEIIPPIQSRCQKYRFKPIDSEDMVRRMRFIAQKEGINTTDKVLRHIAESTNGDIREAINKLQMDERPKDELEEIFAEV